MLEVPLFRMCPKLGQGTELAFVPQILTRGSLLSWNMKRAGVTNGGVENLQLKKAWKCKSNYSLILFFFSGLQ